MKVMESLGCRTKVYFISISIFLVYFYPQRNPESVKTKLFFNQYLKSINLDFLTFLSSEILLQ
jgi:hypothetical protein